ncbi:hypothetical protein LINGRAHAP2_LOCUS10665 [Linum grandiflorum]
MDDSVLIQDLVRLPRRSCYCHDPPFFQTFEKSICHVQDYKIKEMTASFGLRRSGARS